MDDDAAHDFCLNLPSSELTYPFGFETAVYKVRGKVFAIMPLDSEGSTITLKSPPEDAAELTREHAGIVPGYHMNKRHWISVDLASDLPEGLVEELIATSYRCVIAGLPRALRPLA